MHLSEDRRKLRNQEKIKFACEMEVFDFLDATCDMIAATFPNAKLVRDNTSPSGADSLELLFFQKYETYKKWIIAIFEKAIQISTTDTYTEETIEPIPLIPNIAHRLIRDLLKILSEGHNLTTDNGLLFINDVGVALGVDTHTLDLSIEQIQYERRKEFTQRLLDFLTTEQRAWVALMLWKAVHVDEKVDFREYKYFENIMQLLDYEQEMLSELKAKSEQPIELPKPFFDPRLCVHLYRYIVEIVMIDETYTSEEAVFIQTVGQLFGYDKMQQDEIIQPIAAALMTRKSLFSY